MKKDRHSHSLINWITEKRKQRGLRALERQLDYQRKKAKKLIGQEKGTILEIFHRSTSVRERLEKFGANLENAKILEVGSGAHGLIFGLGKGLRIGIDPLAADYKRLFPVWQGNAQTIAAIGEKLPFADSSFDVVLSDNVIDHAENPIAILKDIARVLKPSGLFYFTVNVHHPAYSVASSIHGYWNALGIRYEISPFADHTVHFSLPQIKKVLSELPLKILHESSNIKDLISANKAIKPLNSEMLIKKMFFKNALFEIIALRK